MREERAGAGRRGGAVRRAASRYQVPRRDARRALVMWSLAGALLVTGVLLVLLAAWPSLVRVVGVVLAATACGVALIGARELRRAQRLHRARQLRKGRQSPTVEVVVGHDKLKRAARQATVTVVVPAYMEESRVESALQSLREQTYPYWRAIVVDDQSSDGTSGVALATGDPRIEVVRLRRNVGLPAARNVGLSLVATPYVQFLDADDTLFPRALEQRVATLEENPDVAGAYGKIRQVSINADWRRESRRGRLVATKRLVTLVSAAGENPFGIHEVLMRTEAAHALGGFDESLRTGGEDVDFWARSLRSGHEYVGTGWVDCLYRQTPESMVSLTPVRHMENVVGLLDRAWRAESSRAEVEHSPALDGDLGGVLRRSVLETRMFRYLGMASFAGDEAALSRVTGDLRAAAPLVTSRQSARHPVLVGVARSAKRARVDPGAYAELVGRAVDSGLERVSDLFVTSEPRPLPRSPHPSWALLLENSGHAAAVLATLDGVPRERWPVFLVADSVDADQGATDHLERHAPHAVRCSIPKLVLDGVAYATVVVPEPVSWVGRLVAEQVARRGSEVVTLELPASERIAVVDEETTEVGIDARPEGAARTDLAGLTGLAARQDRDGRPRTAVHAYGGQYAGRSDKSGSSGDYDGLRRPSIERLMELKDSRRGQRCVIIGNGPSLNTTDLAQLAGVPTFGVNGIYYADTRLPEPLTYYVVEDTKVFEENTADVLAYGRTVGTMLLPTLYAPSCGPEDDPVFFRMNGGFYRRSGQSFSRARFSTNASEVLYCGQSVTIINLQLAYWMGFAEVALIGMDFSYSIPTGTKVEGALYTSTGPDPNHFDSRYFGAGKTWKDPKLHRVKANYELARTVFEADGRRIVNSTVGGALEVFDRVALADFTR